MPFHPSALLYHIPITMFLLQPSFMEIILSPSHPSGTKAHLVSSLPLIATPRSSSLLHASALLRLTPFCYTTLSCYSCCYRMKSESEDVLSGKGSLCFSDVYLSDDNFAFFPNSYHYSLCVQNPLT